jgi:hypothetical protein
VNKKEIPSFVTVQCWLQYEQFPSSIFVSEIKLHGDQQGPYVLRNNEERSWKERECFAEVRLPSLDILNFSVDEPLCAVAFHMFRPVIDNKLNGQC